MQRGQVMQMEEEDTSKKSSKTSNSMLKPTRQLANLHPLDMLPYALQHAQPLTGVSKKFVAYKQMHSVHPPASIQSRSQIVDCVKVERLVPAVDLLSSRLAVSHLASINAGSQLHNDTAQALKRYTGC